MAATMKYNIAPSSWKKKMPYHNDAHFNNILTHHVKGVLSRRHTTPGTTPGIEWREMLWQSYCCGRGAILTRRQDKPTKTSKYVMTAWSAALQERRGGPGDTR